MAKIAKVWTNEERVPPKFKAMIIADTSEHASVILNDRLESEGLERISQPNDFQESTIDDIEELINQKRVHGYLIT